MVAPLAVGDSRFSAESERCVCLMCPPPSPSQQDLRQASVFSSLRGLFSPLFPRPDALHPIPPPGSSLVTTRATALFSAVDDGHINVRQIDHVPVVVLKELAVRQVPHYTENGT